MRDNDLLYSGALVAKNKVHSGKCIMEMKIYELTLRILVIKSVRFKRTEEDTANIFHNTLKIDADLYLLNFKNLKQKLFTFIDLTQRLGKQFYVEHIIETNNIIEIQRMEKK